MTKRGLSGIAVALGICGLVGLSAGAERREYLLVTNEIKWVAKAGEAGVLDRGRGPVKEMERYTFDPGFLVVHQGDTVVLRIHGLKGSKHVVEVPAFKTASTEILRGEEKAVSFVADRPGVFEIVCTLHDKPEEEGPMRGYLYVVGK